MALARKPHFQLRFTTWTLTEMQRAIQEKLASHKPHHKPHYKPHHKPHHKLVFGFCSIVCENTKNLKPKKWSWGVQSQGFHFFDLGSFWFHNRNAKDWVGTGWGYCQSYDWTLLFLMALAMEPHFQLRFTTWTLAEMQKTIKEKLEARLWPSWQGVELRV